MKEAPKFHPKVVIPQLPEGMMLVKFHNEPAFIPQRNGEELVGKTIFTEKQLDALRQLGIERIIAIREKNGLI